MKLIVLLICFTLCSVIVCADVVAPTAMTNAAVGGADFNIYTPGVQDGKGLNNIGLLVRVWGKVTAVNENEKYFYIDDGSNRTDASGNIGVRVSYSDLAIGTSIAAPVLNSYVILTAISSTVVINDKTYSNLRPRNQDDIQIIF